MTLLLDTCTFLWFLADAPQLSKRARAAILDPANSVYLSVVSGWEIGRKHARGELSLPARPEALIPQVRTDSGIFSLPLVEEDAISAEKLPLHHRDPFDRMIIAQALMQGMVIVTPDPAFGSYLVRLLW